jgi:aspartokinase-like uncharacterized kinase
VIISSTPLCVVKVGGSLLDWKELPEQLARFLEARDGQNIVLSPGGGAFVDRVREFHAMHRLSDEQSHWLAIRTLDVVAHLLQSIASATAVVDDITAVPSVWNQRMLPILAPRRFLEEDDELPYRLPHTWETTSDSIAARLAVRLGAAELVLLKSAPIAPGVDRAGAARLDLVDRFFPEVSARVPRVLYRNLRDPWAPEVLLAESDDN